MMSFYSRFGITLTMMGLVMVVTNVVSTPSGQKSNLRCTVERFMRGLVDRGTGCVRS